MTGDDRDLYDAFAEARREDAEHAPPMSFPARRRPEHRRRSWSGALVVGTACAAALVVAAVWLRPALRPSDHGSTGLQEQAVVSITTWKPATDFLLDTPGRALLRGVPVIGESHGVARAPGHG